MVYYNDAEIGSSSITLCAYKGRLWILYPSEICVHAKGSSGMFWGVGGGQGLKSWGYEVAPSQCNSDPLIVTRSSLSRHFLFLYDRCGPLVRYWCMRFEGKHNYFKDLAHHVKCFKNIAKTLATRHQHLMCSYLGTSTPGSPFCKDAMVGPGVCMCVRVCVLVCVCVCVHVCCDHCTVPILVTCTNSGHYNTCTMDHTVYSIHFISTKILSSLPFKEDVICVFPNCHDESLVTRYEDNNNYYICGHKYMNYLYCFWTAFHGLRLVELPTTMGTWLWLIQIWFRSLG